MCIKTNTNNKREDMFSTFYQNYVSSESFPMWKTLLCSMNLSPEGQASMPLIQFVFDKYLFLSLQLRN